MISMMLPINRPGGAIFINPLSPSHVIERARTRCLASARCQPQDIIKHTGYDNPHVVCYVCSMQQDRYRPRVERGTHEWYGNCQANEKCDQPGPLNDGLHHF